MTLEEFKKRRAEIEKLRADIPTIYDDFLSKYENYTARHTANDIKIGVLYYELENVKGIDPSKERATYNHDAHVDKYYKISDEIARLEKENSFIDNCLKGIEYVRDLITDSSLKSKITECYFKTMNR